eukprot:s219_g5.t1
MVFRALSNLCLWVWPANKAQTFQLLFFTCIRAQLAAQECLAVVPAHPVLLQSVPRRHLRQLQRVMLRHLRPLLLLPRLPPQVVVECCPA